MKRSLQIICCFLFLGSMAAAQEAPATLKVGMRAPEITLTGIDGESFKLSDIVAQGKNVALMFDRAHW
jgi:hypothetical protein